MRLWVWFEPDLLPGYAWSFPLPGGRANVGFGVRRDGGPPRPGHEGAVAGAAGPAARRRGARARRAGPRHRTRRGRSRPASTGPCSAPRPGAVRRRRRRRHRPDDRRGHRPGAAHRHRSPAEAIVGRGRRLAPDGGPRGYRGAVRARARAPTTACPSCSARVAAPPTAAPAAAVRTRRASAMDAAQLRPLAVRGRAPRRRPHPPPLAPPVPRPPRRLSPEARRRRPFTAVTPWTSAIVRAVRSRSARRRARRSAHAQLRAARRRDAATPGGCVRPRSVPYRCRACAPD